MKLTFHTPDQGILDFEILKSSILIGRGSSCDIVIKTEGISRQHCRIDTNSKGEILITDLGSTNGVLIDEERIPLNTPTPYANYLPLTIGSISKVTIEPSAVVAVEEKVVLSAKNMPELNITLDLPKNKSRSFGRRGLKNKSSELEVTTSRDLPKPIIVAAFFIILAVTYFFFFH